MGTRDSWDRVLYSLDCSKAERGMGGGGMTDEDAEMLIALIRSKIVGKYILVSKVVFDWYASRAKEE